MLCIALLLALSPLPASSQARVTVEGRVFDSISSMPVAGASVELAGVDSRLTNLQGDFSFGDVPAGTYRLAVRLLGYRTHETQLVLRADTALTIVLEIDAVVLDSIRARARFVDVRGVVRQAGSDHAIPNAVVSVSPREAVTSNLRGEFRVRAVPEGVPALVEIGALGYMPAHFNILPAEGETLDVELTEDSVGQRMIAQQVARIETRARSVPKPLVVLDREDLEENYGWPVDMAIVSRLGRSIRPMCLIIDEVSYEKMVAPGESAMDLVATYMTQEIERIEVFDFGRMVRVYTRRYIQKMIDGNAPRLIPILVDVPSQVACSQ